MDQRVLFHVSHKAAVSAGSTQQELNEMIQAVSSLSQFPYLVNEWFATTCFSFQILKHVHNNYQTI